MATCENLPAWRRPAAACITGRKRGREEERTRGGEDERRRGREEERTRGGEDERTRGREEERTRGREDERTRGREDERTRGREDERTIRGREDERTRGREVVLYDAGSGSLEISTESHLSKFQLVIMNCHKYNNQ